MAFLRRQRPAVRWALAAALAMVAAVVALVRDGALAPPMGAGQTLRITRTLAAVQAPSPPPVLGPISFINASTGWAAAAPLDTGTYTTLLSTTDGGGTWRSLATLPASATSLDFVSAHTGWAAVGGKLYETTDGGIRWSALPQAADTVAFSSAVHGWALSRLAPGTVPPASPLLRTVDGGARWSRVAEPCSVVALDGLGGGWDAAAIATPAPGVALLLCTGQPSAGFEPKVVFETADGGQIWTEVFSGSVATEAGYADAMRFSSPTDGWILCGGGTAGAFVYHTTDGGHQWSVVLGLPSTENAWGMAFPTADQTLLTKEARRKPLPLGMGMSRFVASLHRA